MPSERNLQDLALQPQLEECLDQVELPRQEARVLVDLERRTPQLRPLVEEIQHLVEDCLARTSLHLVLLLRQLPIPSAALLQALPLEAEVQEHLEPPNRQL